MHPAVLMAISDFEIKLVVGVECPDHITEIAMSSQNSTLLRFYISLDIMNVVICLINDVFGEISII